MSRFGASLGCVARKNRGYRQNGSEIIQPKFSICNLMLVAAWTNFAACH